MATSASTYSERDRSAFTELQLKAADLRIAKIKSEKEFIGLQGKELAAEEASAIENKRREILYQLELEGAQIERDYIEIFRSKITNGTFGHLGDLRVFDFCIVCETCVTHTCLTCVACASCVLISAI